MMRVRLNRAFTAVMMILAGALMANAQEVGVDTTIILNPGEWIPADTGYYKMGVDKDLVGNDGITEHYDKCFDAYGDDDHREGGEQFGWQYGRSIIFRGCDTAPETLDDVIKGTQPTENWPSVGNLIQLGKHKYPLTDSSSTGYLISPEFTEITSLEIKVSTDVSINPNRTIWMLVEASLDGGNTWEYVDNPDGEAFIYQQLASQGGDIWTYTAGSDAGFDKIIEESQTKAIQIRILPINPPFTTIDGQRLKIWEVTIVAKTNPYAKKDILSNSIPVEPFTIADGEFIASKGRTLTVYSMSGVKLGSGVRVPVCSNGLYIVRTNDGITSKIYLK